MALTLHGTVADNTAVLSRPNAKPIIINGDMAVAQRATSATGLTSASYPVCDRWLTDIGTGGTWTVSQAADAPTGSGFRNSTKYDCTTANGSLSAGSYMTHQMRFEGQDLQLFKKGTSSAESFTVSFWVKSAKTGTYIVELEDMDNTRQVSQAYTISSADTWEKKVLSFPADTTGAFADDNASSLHMFFWLLSGTTYASGTLSTTWTSKTNANRAVGQVNLADSTDNDWYITGVQLEVGDFDANSIAPFQHELFGDSLKRCERYFCKSYNYSTAPGTNASSDANAKRGAVFVYRQRDTNNVGFSFFHPSEMRAVPTMTNFSHDGTSGKFTSSTTTTTISTNAALNGTRLSMAYGAGTAADDNYAHFRCEAEL